MGGEEWREGGCYMQGTVLALEKDNFAIVKQTRKHANTAGKEEG